MTVQRVFLGWNQPILRAGMRYLLDRYATPDSCDLSQVVLVVPGRRPARAARASDDPEARAVARLRFCWKKPKAAGRMCGLRRFEPWEHCPTFCSRIGCSTRTS